MSEDSKKHCVRCDRETVHGAFGCADRNHDHRHFEPCASCGFDTVRASPGGPCAALNHQHRIEWHAERASRYSMRCQACGETCTSGLFEMQGATAIATCNVCASAALRIALDWAGEDAEPPSR